MSKEIEEILNSYSSGDLVSEHWKNAIDFKYKNTRLEIRRIEVPKKGILFQLQSRMLIVAKNNDEKSYFISLGKVDGIKVEHREHSNFIIKHSLIYLSQQSVDSILYFNAVKDEININTIKE